MEISRIRYNKIDENTFVNRTTLILNGQLLKVELVGLEWRILTSAGIKLDQGFTRSNVELKAAVKNSLKKLGVNFLDELRTKKFVDKK